MLSSLVSTSSAVFSELTKPHPNSVSVPDYVKSVVLNYKKFMVINIFISFVGNLILCNNLNYAVAN